MLVHSFLEHSAEQYPDKDAVWYKDEWLTFGQINTLSNKVANYLLQTGIKHGDRVALLYENSHDYVINYYAILKAGAVTVSLNTDCNAESLSYLLNDCGAKTIITNKRFSRHLIPALQTISCLKTVIIDQDDLTIYKEIKHCNPIYLKKIYNSQNSDKPNCNIIDLDLASIVYTSGSTAKPKGVVLSYLNIVSNTHSIIEYLEITDLDRIMVVLPFYYIYGKSLLNTHFFKGASVVIDNRFAYPNVILETMKKTEVSGFSGVPSTFMILLNKSSVKEYTFNSLRYVTQAGGAMAPAIQKKVAKTFSPARLFIMYGATEASARLTYLDPSWLDRKWGSIGKAITNVRVFIGDENGNEKVQGETGEILAIGSNLMQGYWNDPAETNIALKNGCYYTGDIGVMDKDGFLFVVGRKKDMIKVGGERISAKEIEEKILEMDLVNEVAIIGVEDEILGEAIKAFIVPEDINRVNIDSIKRQLIKKLPAAKQPKFWELTECLPKNESGKVLKTKLKQI